jgi:hypothetical protein
LITEDYDGALISVYSFGGNGGDDAQGGSGMRAL